MVSVSCLSAMLTTVVAMFLSHQVAPLDACSCKPKHPQSEYCATDWAIRAWVQTTQIVKDTTTSYNKDLRLYEVKIHKVFKEGKQCLKKGSSMKLYTPASDNFCGASLKLKNTYYIQGMTEKGQLWFDQCDTPRMWSSLPRLVQKGYNKFYKKNCHCTIETSMRKQHASNSSCTMSSSWDKKKEQCYKDHAGCVRHQKKKEVSPSRSSCKWSGRRGVRKCMKSANDKSSKGRFNWEP